MIYSQVREDVTVHIPRPTGGLSEQQSYFLDNFTMETTAAGYTVVDSPTDSDYILHLQIKPNLILYDDGSMELAPPDEPQNILELKLVETEGNTDIIQFEFPFTDLMQMDEYNLYLLYQAMANVPLTKLTANEEDDWWRHKWLYLRFSFDFNVPVFLPDKDWYVMDYNDGIKHNVQIFHLVPFAPGITFGMELDFLDFLAAELDLSLLLGNVEGASYNYDPVATIDVSLKYPIRLAKHYMLEPYAGVTFPLALLGGNLPRFGIQGGLQVATKAGDNGGFFVNVRGEYDFGHATTKIQSTGDIINWTRFVIGISAGYKLGFFNREKK